MSPTKNKEIHIHTYKRVKKGKEKTNLFMCLDPDCRHYSQAHLLENKRALCPYCGNDYRLTKEQLRTMTMPHCETCTGQIRRKKTKNEVEEQPKQDLNLIEAKNVRELVDKVEQPQEEAESLITLEERLTRLLGK